MKCRYCNSKFLSNFIDLGFAPPSNAYVTSSELNASEKYYPLKTFVCNECKLVQTFDYTNSEELFNSEYAYFSSTSTTWVKHAEKYSEEIIDNLKLTNKSMVIEIASNDGYLLKNFIKKKIPCLGIEPTLSTSKEAKKLGINVIERFFGKDLAIELSKKNILADLIVANNVYAHVPDIRDFTLGLKIILKDAGVITLEFPHLLNLIKHNQFDTIYHEHFSYLTLNVTKRIFEDCGLKVWNVEKLRTHGGSLRIYGCHKEDRRKEEIAVNQLLDEEEKFGLENIKIYQGYQLKAEKIRYEVLKYLIDRKEKGFKVAAYGAAAKGNTLLNFSGIKNNLLEYVVDEAESKQGKFLPGSHIPIVNQQVLIERPPDALIILPWNLFDEIIAIVDQKIKKPIELVRFIPETKILHI